MEIERGGKKQEEGEGEGPVKRWGGGGKFAGVNYCCH